MVSDSTAPDSLVNRVTRAIFRSGPLLQVPNEAEDQARAAIREVAEWLRENDSNCQMGGDAAVTADLLDAEARTSEDDTFRRLNEVLNLFANE